MHKALGIAAAAAATLVVASASQAAVIATVTDLGNPTTSGGTTAPDYQAYRITLTSDSGQISGVDAGATPASPFGVDGSFLQRVALVATEGGTRRDPTPFSTAQNNSDTSASLDTHFLTEGNVVATAVNEDFNGTNPPGAPADNSFADFGSGTYLAGVIGFNGAALQTTLDLVYVVKRDDTAASYNFNVATTGGTFPVTGVIPATAPIPEPAALGLLAIGGLFGLRRRRA